MRHRKTPLPARVEPQLVSLVTRPPAGDWRYEIKFDGYRMLARLDAGVALITKNGHDWTHRMPGIAGDLHQLPVVDTWIDGEVVALNEDGQPAFHLLQQAFSSSNTHDLVYYAFDLMFVAGVDIRGRPVEERRELLKTLLDERAVF